MTQNTKRYFTSVPLVLLEGPINSTFLKTMKHNFDTNKTFTVDVDAKLRADCDAAAIHIGVEGDAINVRFSSMRVAIYFFRELNDRHTLKAVDWVLKCIDVTVYWHNSRLGILGSKSSPILLQTLIGVQRIIKWSALSVSRLRFFR